MQRHHRAFLSALCAIWLLGIPGGAAALVLVHYDEFEVALAKTDAKLHWAEIKRDLGGFGQYMLAKVGLRHDVTRADEPSMTVRDFAGSWSRHGIGLMFLTNGQGNAEFRTYRWCKDAAAGDACDDPNGAAITAAGHAQLLIERVENRTAYGTVSESNDQQMMPNGPFTLTEYWYGMGQFRATDTRPPWAPEEERLGVITLCGPRSESMPDWVRAQHPCGA